MNKHILSCFDHIYANEELKLETYQKVINKTKTPSYQNIDLIIAFIACLFIGCCFVLKSHFTSVTQDDKYSYISIDYTMSLEFVLDDQKRIIDTITYNEAAQNISQNNRFQNQYYLDALSILFNNDDQIDTSDYDIHLTVYSQNVETYQNLTRELQTFMKNQFSQMSYQYHQIDQNTYSQAKSLKISSGQYFLIQFIINNDSSFTLEDLQNKDITEILYIYTSLTKRNTHISQDVIDDYMSKIKNTMPQAVYDELVENGVYYELSDTFFIANDKYDPTLRLDFSYKEHQFIGYVSKEYGFVNSMENDMISEEEAFELAKRVGQIFFERDVHLKKIESLSGYESDNYITLEDDYHTIYLIALDKNMVIKLLTIYY